jgi:hypothetical protein
MMTPKEEKRMPVKIKAIKKYGLMFRNDKK